MWLIVRMRQTLVILFGCLISEMLAVFREFTTSWVLEPENATYCFPSIPGNEAVDSCARDQLISLSSKPTFLLCNIGSVSCFVMLDPGNILLCRMVGCKPSSTEGTRINLPRDDKQTFLWPVVLLCYFSMLGSWEAPAAPLATLSPPEASKHLQTTRTLQQHMATSIDLHPPTHSGSFEGFQRSGLLMRTLHSQMGSGHLWKPAVTWDPWQVSLPPAGCNFPW